MKTRIAALAIVIVVAWASPAQAQVFTVEINRGQADSISLSMPKASANGLAFTWAFEQHNLNLVAIDLPPLTSEPVYLRDVILLPALQSWRRQQLRAGVTAALAIADETQMANVRAALGLP